MASQEKPFYTFEEYLGREREAEHRSEYRDGAIIAMAGGTARHSELCARMISLLTRQLRDCRIFDSNLRIYIEEFNESTYSDAMAICGGPQYWRSQTDVVTNPTVAVEVLSPSTKKYDQTTKRGYYLSLPSLLHLVLVAQDDVAIEWSSRHQDTWITTKYTNRSDLTPLGFLVGELYDAG